MADRRPFQRNSYADIFCSISNVDWETGYSDDVPKDELELNGLTFGNGGSWCRDDGALGKVFNVTRTKKRGRIVSVRLDGFNLCVRSPLL